MAKDLFFTKNEFVFLDIEGTGPKNFDKEEIIEIGAVLLKKGKASKTYYTKVKPKNPIPFFISRVHNLYKKDLASSKDINEIKNDFLNFIVNRIIVAHNAATEKRILQNALPDYSPFLILDTLKLTRHLYSNIENYSMENLLKYFSLDKKIKTTTKQHQNSLIESKNCLLLFKHLVSTLPENSRNIEIITKICSLEVYDKAHLKNKI